MKPFSLLLLASSFSTIPSAWSSVASASPLGAQANRDGSPTAAEGISDRNNNQKNPVLSQLPGALVGSVLATAGVGGWAVWRDRRRNKQLTAARQAETASSEALFQERQRGEASAMLKYKQTLAQRGLRRSFKVVRRPAGGQLPNLVNEPDLLPETLASDAEMMDCLLFYHLLGDKVKKNLFLNQKNKQLWFAVKRKSHVPLFFVNSFCTCVFFFVISFCFIFFLPYLSGLYRFSR
jgi:hypothetical protein